ncbi:MAG: hypothetical protein UX35_C0005G0046 [Microgenomates group bacterium GW2011_GWA1_46_15]|nr:MAG: hypothetical protein UX00_C0007G0030 [Microgenomates group bacterium GW2011_GWB1_45_17]KKU23544.1 MAG: hypothetical protein UX35_C0005G0046 [Microgenomates group bacterium GW2011_GWA1_46_15]KKU24429.1 MAG: hypothetical protein UX36_C0001G0046 [Microgenomates group bacterium GW2011_GWC1_46_15]
MPPQTEHLTPEEVDVLIEDSITHYPTPGTGAGGGTSSSIPMWHRTNWERLHLPGMKFCPTCQEKGENPFRLGTRRCCQICGTVLESQPPQESQAVMLSAPIMRALVSKE